MNLIRLGARYNPCMHVMPNISLERDQLCADSGLNNQTCSYYENMAYICGMGGFNNPKQPNQWWRFITPIWIHVGFIHLLMNLLMLYRTGSALERQMGSIRFGIVYLISGIGGNLFSALLAPKSSKLFSRNAWVWFCEKVTAGASSAIFGIFGMSCVEMAYNYRLLLEPLKDIAILLLNLLLSFSIGLLPYVDNYSHIGGFLTGILIGGFALPKIYYSRADYIAKSIAAILALSLLILFMSLGFVEFYTNPSDKTICTWCVWLDCITPYSSWCALETGSWVVDVHVINGFIGSHNVIVLVLAID